jgi:hypothetical protein
MGSKYTTQSSSGYNSSPPSDDGTTSEANKVKWATTKTKLADPIKTLADAINSQLVTALDTSARAVSAGDSAAATDHWRTIQVNTPSVTITLSAATTMAAGYIVDVANQSSGSITVALASATDTIDTVTNTTHSISAKETRRYIVNATATGYITASRNTVSDAASMAITNSISGNVALNNTGTYFTGPTVAQGTEGTWFASGTVTLTDTANVATFNVKLWDGTTVIASAEARSVAANEPLAVSVSGFIANPAGNIRISVNDVSLTTGVILFNASGTSKDSTVTAVRIA